MTLNPERGHAMTNSTELAWTEEFTSWGPRGGMIILRRHVILDPGQLCKTFDPKKLGVSEEDMVYARRVPQVIAVNLP